ncbi:unnamed protein product, partial [Ectocarpus sp. 12 AP-2014]
AVQGRVDEASIGFAANATAFGEAWTSNHLRSWRRHLGRKCSGIGMTGVFEGAERLIIHAGAHARSTRGSFGEAEHVADGLLFGKTDM